MIISRTPFRVSFLGGGSDLPGFYRNSGYGAVISAAIKQYMYIMIHPYFQDKIRIKYSKTEDVNHIDELEHPIVRECLRKVGIGKGVEIASFADIASGTGLGSSSSFTVGLLNALYAYRGIKVSKQILAEQACEIEIDILGEPIGKQDQYAAAYGNVNYIRFNFDESVDLTPLNLPSETINKLEKRLKLYYLGGKRKARAILTEQAQQMSKSSDSQKRMTDLLTLVEDLRHLFEQSTDIERMGALLHQGWELKRSLTSKISSSFIDKMYGLSREHGAQGGKLLGAGGSGFLLLYHDNHERLEDILDCKSLPFCIDADGSKIIYQD